MNVLHVTLDYPPSANHRTELRPRRTKAGKLIMRPVKTETAAQYEKDVGWLARKAGAELIEGPVAVEMHLYRPAGRHDLDNAQKSIFDALTGICWNDDVQVTEAHVYAHDGDKRPRVELTVAEADAAGLVLLRAKNLDPVTAGALAGLAELITKGE